MSRKPKANSNIVISDFLEDRFTQQLRNTTPVKKLPSPLRENLEALYADKHLNAHFLACLINGLYTEKLGKFLFSVKEFEALIKADHKSKNLKKRKSLNDGEFKSFKRYLVDRKIIAIDEDSTPFEAGKKGGKSAKCRIIHPTLRKLIGFQNFRDIDTQWFIQGEDDISRNQNDREENLQIKEDSPEYAKVVRDGVKKRMAARVEEKFSSDDQENGEE